MKQWVSQDTRTHICTSQVAAPVVLVTESEAVELSGRDLPVVCHHLKIKMKQRINQMLNKTKKAF